MNWYLAVLKNYAGFSGRARRTEYWMFTLVNLVISVVLEIIALAAHPVIYIEWIYALAVLVPSLAVLSRRLHDSGKSFWWVLIGLIPFIGAIVLLVFTCLPGTLGPNQYGSDPKEVRSYA
jgi:uncharacterized membrane protein YhaH (DUF805 family)